MEISISLPTEPSVPATPISFAIVDNPIQILPSYSALAINTTDIIYFGTFNNIINDTEIINRYISNLNQSITLTGVITKSTHSTSLHVEIKIDNNRYYITSDVSSYDFSTGGINDRGDLVSNIIPLYSGAILDIIITENNTSGPEHGIGDIIFTLSDISLADIAQKFIYTNKTKINSIISIMANEENLYGVSLTRFDLIRVFALLYVDIIIAIEQSYNPDWTIYDWLTDEEYDTFTTLKLLEEYV